MAQATAHVKEAVANAPHRERCQNTHDDGIGHRPEDEAEGDSIAVAEDRLGEMEENRAVVTQRGTQSWFRPVRQRRADEEVRPRLQMHEAP